MLTATEKRSTIGERPADEHPRTFPAAEEAVTMGTHPTTRPTHRAAEDGRTALPAHLSLLRQALAESTGRNRGTGKDAGDRAQAPRLRPDRTARTTQLTLAQWVSRTARIGNAGDARLTAG
ncbi:hypothetical protein [Streptomyces sp. NPDC056061]|uniref:hypothetical protein n=1 Tax=Streptomyces sp. NPDC056061 TaxID=3345700 RepID=UPI0035E2544D